MAKVSFELGKIHHPSFPTRDTATYQGLVHTVAETILADIIDKTGNRFTRRFLLDSGGAMTLFSIYSLPEEGVFDIVDISDDPLKVSGVFEGVQKKAEKWTKLTIAPVSEINPGEDKFHLEIDAYLVPERDFPEIKRELPLDLREEIAALECEPIFSDPIILERGNELIKCDGIIGQCYRNAFDLHRIYRFSDRLVIKRTPFGDVLSGPTHLLTKETRKIRFTKPIIYERGVQRFYKTRPMTDEEQKFFNQQEGSGYVPLAIKPGGECSGSDEKIKVSTAELTRLCKDYLKKEVDELGIKA